MGAVMMSAAIAGGAARAKAQALSGWRGGHIEFPRNASSVIWVRAHPDKADMAATRPRFRSVLKDMTPSLLRTSGEPIPTLFCRPRGKDISQNGSVSTTTE